MRPGIRGSTIVSRRPHRDHVPVRAGSEWEEHHHPEDQLTIVISGEIVFRTGTGEIRLGPGEQVLIPGGVPHSATAGQP